MIQFTNPINHATSQCHIYSICTPTYYDTYLLLTLFTCMYNFYVVQETSSRVYGNSQRAVGSEGFLFLMACKLTKQTYSP